MNTIHIPSEGLCIARGGADDIYRLPERETPPTNDWLDRDGLDCDLSNPVWRASQRGVGLHISPTRALGWDSELMAADRVEIRLHSALPPLSMRIMGTEQYKHRGGLVRRPEGYASSTLLLALDEPEKLLDGITAVPHRSPHGECHVALNGMDLHILGGVVHSVYSSALAPHSPKSILMHSSSYTSGVSLPEPKRFYRKAQIIEIDMSIVGESILEAMQSYRALWQLLAAPGKLTLRTARTLVDCYYMRQTKLKLYKNRLSMTLQMQEI